MSPSTRRLSLPERRDSFDRDPLECSRHPGFARMACSGCFADGALARSDVGSRIVAEARKLIGTPYAHHGRTRNGLDCTGLAKLARLNAGLPDDGDFDYREDLLDVDAVAEISKRAKVDFDLDATEEGEAILFRMRSRWWHFGVLTAEGTIIAALRRSKGVIEHTFDYRWARRAVLRVKVR